MNHSANHAKPSTANRNRKLGKSTASTIHGTIPNTNAEIRCMFVLRCNLPTGSSPTVAREMEEYRRGKDHGIEAVEYAAVPADHVAPILGTAVALDRGHHEAAQEPHDVDRERHRPRLPWGERRDWVEHRPERRGTQHAADQPLPGFRWRDRRRNLAASRELAPDVLQHVARLHDDDQENQQQKIPAGVPAYVERQQ